MKKLFTLLVLVLFISQISFAQDLEPGFYPPEGSTFNEDSSVVTLPSAYLDSYYSDTIVFYVSETFSVDLGGEILELPFNFAEITSVTTPNGLDYSCNPTNCYFEPNTSGEVILSGVPTDLGIHQLDLTAFVSIDATPLGLPMDIEFTIPYTGGNALLDIALAGDYSGLNDVVPTFLIEVISSIEVVEGCTDLNALNYNPNATITDGSCEYSEAYIEALQAANAIAYANGAASVDITSDNQTAFDAGVASVEITECEEISSQNIPLYLSEGWSMFGYTCLEPIDAVSYTHLTLPTNREV